MYKRNCCKLDERHSCIVFEMSVNVLPFQPLLSPSASDNQQPGHMTSLQFLYFQTEEKR